MKHFTALAMIFTSLILLLSLSACSTKSSDGEFSDVSDISPENISKDEEKDLTGEPVYIADIQIINGAVWRTSPHDEVAALYKDDVLISEFSSNPQYSEHHKAYFYLKASALYSYSPDTGEPTFICDFPGSAYGVTAVTENYVLLSAGKSPQKLLSLSDGSFKNSETLSSGFPKILDVSGDTILLQDHFLNSLCLYDCSSDTLTALAENVSTAQAGLIDGDTVYYCENNGPLTCVNITGGSPSSPEVLEPQKSYITAMENTEKGILCAVKTRSYGAGTYCLSFHLLSPDGTFAELCSWDEVNYYLPGSCLLSAGENSFACAVTYDPGIFTAPLS